MYLVMFHVATLEINFAVVDKDLITLLCIPIDNYQIKSTSIYLTSKYVQLRAKKTQKII